MNSNCHTCKESHGTRIDFMFGMTCKECGFSNPTQTVVYTHDEVDDANKYWHHYEAEQVIRCRNCGHSAIKLRKPCKNSELQAKSEMELDKPEFCNA